MSNETTRRSFEPSWMDKFLTWLGRLPAPRWFNFLLIPVTLFILAHAVLYLLEPGMAWTVQNEVANVMFWFAFSLTTYAYLLSSSDRALEEFRPSLDIDDIEFIGLRLRFNTLARPWGFLFIPAIGLTFLFMRFRPAIDAPAEIAPVIRMILIVLGSITFTFLAYLMVLVIQVLKHIKKLYDRISNINIYDLQDLYALSTLSARIGVFFVIAGTLSFVINIAIAGDQPQIELAVFFISLNSLMAVIVFLLPLVGIHSKLADAKRTAERENNRRLSAALKKLHERSDRSILEEMPLIESQVGALMEFRREIEKISTWPWQPQTLRGFITAISLPIVVWLIQQLLSRALGG